MFEKHLALGAAAALASLFVFAIPAAAQNAEMGKDIWLSQADCRNCHGWAGDGIPEPRFSKGANLRETVLTIEEISEVVLCGRPGTGMPHYDPRAYNDDRCYGVTREQLGDATPERATVGLVKRHADALAMFITETFIGAGEVTLEQCVALMGPESTRCDPLR
jgi:hypothetical protein